MPSWPAKENEDGKLVLKYQVGCAFPAWWQNRWTRFRAPDFVSEQNEEFTFEGITKEKVEAVLLLLGRGLKSGQSCTRPLPTLQSGVPMLSMDYLNTMGQASMHGQEARFHTHETTAFHSLEHRNRSMIEDPKHASERAGHPNDPANLALT